MSCSCLKLVYDDYYIPIPSLSLQFSTMRANMKLRENVLDLEHRLSDESLMLIEEYNQRIEVCAMKNRLLLIANNNMM